MLHLIYDVIIKIDLFGDFWSLMEQFRIMSVLKILKYGMTNRRGIRRIWGPLKKDKMLGQTYIWVSPCKLGKSYPILANPGKSG